MLEISKIEKIYDLKDQKVTALKGSAYVLGEASLWLCLARLVVAKQPY